MKTAVSIPDDVFAEAEGFACRKGLSRSHVYAKALREYLDRHDPDAITESWNQVIDELGEEAIDPFVQAAASYTFERMERQDRAG
jgi:hypothetical protein